MFAFSVKAAPLDARVSTSLHSDVIPISVTSRDSLSHEAVLTPANLEVQIVAHRENISPIAGKNFVSNDPTQYHFINIRVPLHCWLRHQSVVACAVHCGRSHVLQQSRRFTREVLWTLRQCSVTLRQRTLWLNRSMQTLS